jgi:hypothetical protein
VAEQLEDPDVWSDGTGPYLRDRLDRIDAALTELGVPAVSTDAPGDARPLDPPDARVEDWHRHLGTLHEEPMVAHHPDEVEELTTLARTLLRREGVVRGPDLDLGPLDVAVGDRVVIERELRDGPPPGTPGSVVAVDTGRESCTVDFATWGTLDVGCDTEAAAALAHDYVALERSAAVHPSAAALQAERERVLTLEPEL